MIFLHTSREEQPDTKVTTAPIPKPTGSQSTTETPVEFINNRWFFLQLYCGQYCTKQSLIITLDNEFGLHSYPDPRQIQNLPACPTLCAGFGFDPNVSLSLSSGESTATQQSFSDAREMPALHVNTAVTIQEDPPEQPTLPQVSLFAEPLKDPPENPNPDPIVMTANPPPNRGRALQGMLLNIFNGDRSQSNKFWNEFQQYKLLNRNNDAMSVPFNQVLTALSYI